MGDTRHLWQTAENISNMRVQTIDKGDDIPAVGFSTRQKRALTKCYNGQRNGWYEERDCGYVNETSGSIKADDLSST
jgi:hypothetical protein